MATTPLELRATAIDPALVASLVGYERVGIEGALRVGSAAGSRSSRARRASVPGFAVSCGYRWRWRDAWDQTWWPQGIAVDQRDGTSVALVSWYAQPRRGVEQGSRVSVIDLSNPKRLSYRHVLLVSPRHTDAGIVLEPVLAHAGGVAWVGDRLLVAATFDGIREFRLGDILRAGAGGGPFGYDLVLPEFAQHRPATPNATGRMRYSFITAERAAKAPSPEPAERPEPAEVGAELEVDLVIGEYGRDDLGRLARLRMTGERSIVTETHAPRIRHMQGAAIAHDLVRGDTWFVSASNGQRSGDLWVGAIGGLRNLAGQLPPGPEALTLSGSRNELWSVSEIPGKRFIYAMDVARLVAEG